MAVGPRGVGVVGRVDEKSVKGSRGFQVEGRVEACKFVGGESPPNLDKCWKVGYFHGMTPNSHTSIHQYCGCNFPSLI